MALSLSGSPSSSGHRSGPSRRASRSPGFPRTPSWPFMSLLSPSALTAGPILLRVPGNLTGITAPAAGPQVALRSVTFPPARPQSGHFHSCCTRTSPCHVRDARATSLHACSLFPRCSRRAPTTRNSLPSGPQRRGLSWLSRRPACGRGHWSDLSETASRAKARVLQGPLPAPPPSTRGAAWCQRVLGHLRTKKFSGLRATAESSALTPSLPPRASSHHLHRIPRVSPDEQPGGLSHQRASPILGALPSRQPHLPPACDLRPPELSGTASSPPCPSEIQNRPSFPPAPPGARDCLFWAQGRSLSTVRVPAPPSALSQAPQISAVLSPSLPGLWSPSHTFHSPFPLNFPFN
ncbi:uncharacterized protein LOC123644943 isoform X1 [Lemur catta]|uniref:uncharacterized protein LOC123644943 isoform X1 n=1 Tax=Lemur catta TaxID=9447 RepID=UPI001E2699A7|nr:uncharacterized protein LOC123644943 isoform X1 [Lemur catta]XP_045417365.1 uncharacterized protein LOC123644943 isoform X1 [Lemur catta]XP_045417366.1 uncharacterized protein LOC123644943 isoform X1 [Lemur catta]